MCKVVQKIGFFILVSRYTVYMVCLETRLYLCDLSAKIWVKWCGCARGSKGTSGHAPVILCRSQRRSVFLNIRCKKKDELCKSQGSSFDCNLVVGWSVTTIYSLLFLPLICPLRDWKRRRICVIWRTERKRVGEIHGLRYNVKLL